ncbi:3-hydroxyacyl-CoA dehydrogenase/enoyl-CoA hydratase family protein [Halalkalibacter sp. APA_J-10(15)]|uniref:3-hydroxyacyl-CoA dehydrogenase/enoyl-CoA hydratase family protein n=1 Tax=Halalkalibacter sp. APA_J-10(15) TaxID=2933805 RepID=UPI001FF13640|nr:3-hydroxyacyl-CoA dehydrogenase/enoyl-CoA hydratase family protein [Halalkalibacter sp. APA_J-10(15)]MCK0470970.1 3-hydroxyacyl-CoA dehydrogenase NAD-binding domain-containing protein [Halalkalibacter sp. APA_J-10(15)]
MERVIRKVAVIGSGVMGASIAAHLANVGISSLLLDVCPSELTEQERQKGWSLDDNEVRNRLAKQAIERLKKTKPAPLYNNDFANRIRPGNIDDDLEKVKEVDWVIEVIIENVKVKQQFFERLEKVWQEGTIVSSNTSGVSINEMVNGRSIAFQSHFLGTHFFNPPRYMKLLEVIPGEYTKQEIVKKVAQFGENQLGKGVVIAKDTPNFIANRIGTYGLLVTLQEMNEYQLSIEEVDAVTGPAMGRPKSATFRTLDLVGIDTFTHVANNVYEKVKDEAEKNVFAPSELLLKLVEKGWVGEKAGKGFYEKVRTGSSKEIRSLNVHTLTYEKRKQVSGASLEAAKLAKGARQRLRALLATNDQYSAFAWTVLKRVLLYSAEKVGEIADSIVEIDQAMKWGFNWQLGPFETWDVLGLEKTVARMKQEGEVMPNWVNEWLAAGHTSFYKEEEQHSYYVKDGEWKKRGINDKRISLQSFKKTHLITSNQGASLIDLHDGVACLEFHSPNNAIGADILQMIEKSVELVERDYIGLVLANEGKHFCVGANLMMLLMEAQDEEWDEVEHIIHIFQQTMQKLKHCEKPVVAAPHQMTLGGGVEVCLPADQIVAQAETYVGLVEVGVGLIPAGGGCKEYVRRMSESIPCDQVDVQPVLNELFQTIGMAKVSTSADDAKRLGYLRQNDRVIIHEDQRIYEAKQTVLQLARNGYQPQEEQKIRVTGKEGAAIMKLGANQMKLAGSISEHDHLIACKLAYVLAGGDVRAGTLVSEQYMLDLEREAFLSLCGEPKTQARMEHMLMKGKPLRN